jgi:hypothetical protein
VLRADEIGETDHADPTDDEQTPHHRRDVGGAGMDAHPPLAAELIELHERFAEERRLRRVRRVDVDGIVGAPEALVLFRGDVAPGLFRGQGRPVIVDHRLRVVVELVPDGIAARQPAGIPPQFRKPGGLTGGRALRPFEVLPDDDDGEREVDAVDQSDERVGEAGELVVRPQCTRRPPAHHENAGRRDDHDREHNEIAHNR